ncbi:CHAP domain-containing protein [Candidatus Gracilibacteria bacterium]|nr:CHAP domain-containing protein [Candidatus Gracilibacteria bacterium]
MNLQEFINTYLGKRVDPNGQDKGRTPCFKDPKFPGCHQCVSLIQWYMQAVWKVPKGHGDAKNFIGNLSSKDFDKFFMPTNARPQPGDIISSGPIKGNPYGHIGIVTKLTGDGFEFLEQNGGNGNGYGEGDNAIRIRTRGGYNNIIGWARPKNNPLWRRNVAKRIFDALIKPYLNNHSASEIWNGSNPTQITTRSEVAGMIKNYFSRIEKRTITELKIWNRSRPNDAVSEYELKTMIDRAKSL